MIPHLTNPLEFGTAYPCPSISMDTPDVDPTLSTYGGDSLITSGIWFTVEGLVRYGYDELAAEYVQKTIEMLTRGGPSSAYSCSSVTGELNQGKHTLASQSLIVTDLICKYLIGIAPQIDGGVCVKPLERLHADIDEFSFGPFQYHKKTITVEWKKDSGYHLIVR